MQHFSKIVTLPPKTSIYELQEIKLLISLPIINTEGITVHVHQHKFEIEKPKHLDAINLNETELSSEQKHSYTAHQ